MPALTAALLAVTGCKSSGPLATTSCKKIGWLGYSYTCSVEIGPISETYSYALRDKEFASSSGIAGFPVSAEVSVTSGSALVSWDDVHAKTVSFRVDAGKPGHAKGTVRKRLSNDTDTAFTITFTPVASGGSASPEPVTGITMKLDYEL